MPQHKFNMPGATQTVQTVHWDAEGNPILQIAATEYMIHLPSGEVRSVRTNNAIQLMCGTMWHPGMKDVPVGVCEFCRKPPYTFPFRQKPGHGLVNLKNGARCVSCGVYACRCHIHVGPDGRPRCLDCHRKYRLRAFLRRIFFTYEED